jgi:hypothetical protein
MKQKTIYIIVVVCCLSLFSSAKQAGKKECPQKISCKLNKQKLEEEARAKEKAKASYDLSSLQLFMFSI